MDFAISQSGLEKWEAGTWQNSQLNNIPQREFTRFQQSLVFREFQFCDIAGVTINVIYEILMAILIAKWEYF